MTVEKRIKRAVDLKGYSTFGIGGLADLFFEVTTLKDAQEIMSYAHSQDIPYCVLGKGSNVLFDDRGFKGLIIFNKLQYLDFQDCQVRVGSGYSFSHLGVKSALKNLSGLEFASGIPGSVGGAIYMNAGANQAETVQVLQSVGFVDHQGLLIQLEKKDLVFGYRHSSFQSLQGFIVYGIFQLKHCLQARQRQLDIIRYRMQTQPYKNQSIGCTFKNPNNISAGALIEQCGLKGKVLGGAMISKRHANFIINHQQASAQDVLQLIALVKQTVKEKKDIELVEEIRYIPYER